MKDYLLPPPLLMEKLRERYNGNVSLWSFGAPTEPLLAYCDEYVARGFMNEDWFHVTSWALVLPLSSEKQRLNEALALLDIALVRDALQHINVDVNEDGSAYTLPMEELVRELLGKGEMNVYR